ncbi:MAG: family 43 glycosylhydrolase [Verrucomicrobiae bacterium]|nr:family 43 glycosylhydrolase [Verrucomicrobiae bacterium]
MRLLAFILFSPTVAFTAGTYTNPVISATLADPTVISHAGRYYLYATGDVDGDNGYRVYISTNLVHWKRGPVVFKPGVPHVWAPDVWRDPSSGRFYLYYTANKTVGVAVADTPTGPFVNPKKLFDAAIDAHLFCDDDGKLYLYFVKFPGFRITVQPMRTPTEPGGEPTAVLQPESDWEKRAGEVTEGPWMIKRNGLYYLLYSGSGANTPDYAVGYATARSPLGPFQRAPHNPILRRSENVFGPGHGCAIQDRAGQWWFVYHQKKFEKTGWERFVCLDRLRFDEQGRLFGQATRGVELPTPVTAIVPAKPTSHTIRTIEGWTVHVDDRLLGGPDAALGERALRLLENRLFQIALVLPPDKVAKLRQVPIWLDRTHGKLTGMQYHPDPNWLRDHGYSTNLARSVHIPDAPRFVTARDHYVRQPWAVLHELAHAYHHQVLGHDHPEILAAWKRIKDSGQLESVLHIFGKRERHYALTNEQEFFAEMTEAYFGMNDFFPFNRAELKDSFPEVYKLMRNIWESPPRTAPLP